MQRNPVDQEIGSAVAARPGGVHGLIQGWVDRGWVDRATLVGLVASLVLHAIGAIIGALVTVGHAQAGGAGGSGPVEVATITLSEFDSLSDEALPIDLPSVGEPTAAALDEVELTDAAIADPALEGAGIGELGLDSGAGDAGSGSGLGTGGGGGGAASFFGVEARGTRFAYIVDVSGSMDTQGRIAALRRELSRSLQALPENALYFVAIFSDAAFPLGGRAEWTEASEAGKAWGIRNVGKLMPQGGTMPLPAFRLVFGLRPRPDAVYFMTDGEFDARVVFEVAAMNVDPKVPIHCISLGNDEGAALLRRIAEESGGTYSHVGTVSR